MVPENHRVRQGQFRDLRLKKASDEMVAKLTHNTAKVTDDAAATFRTTGTSSSPKSPKKTTVFGCVHREGSGISRSVRIK